jgi:putative redox protein
MTNDPLASSAPPPAAPTRVRLTWAGEQRFDSGRPDGPTARIDASAETAQGPIDALLTSLAACSATDVIEILAKGRTPAQSLAVDVVGERVETTPRRFRRIALHYTIGGDGIAEPQAARAIELALTKYCSVRACLDPAIAVEFSATVNNTARRST